MLGLGLAASNTPAIFLPKEHWEKVYKNVSPEVVDLQPFMGKDESVEKIDATLARYRAAFDGLRRQIEEYRPEALIIVGSDRSEMFTRINTPTFSIFTGPEVTAADGISAAPETVKGTYKIRCDGTLATAILDGLVQKEFEMSWGSEFKPVGGSVVSHMVSAPYKALVPNMNIPVVPLFINAYSPPLPPASRCWDLGVTLREILAERPERVAILASGGLSYDVAGRWVDEPFDRWILDSLQSGKAEKLKRLFTFDSENLRGPTGEIRSWITVAAAAGGKARVVDYIPSRQAKTGAAFAYWQIAK